MQKIFSLKETNIYKLELPRLQNRYFILSGPLSREMLARPEIVGYPCYSSLLEETAAALLYLKSIGLGGDLDILTILRGGLNYPLEEACFQAGIRVRDIHFLSCERIIEENVIKGLDIKYEKLRPTPGRTLAIGDIIASGATLKICLEHTIREFKRRGGSLRRILFFTIGGTRAIELMEEILPSLRDMFPGFEGIDCFFYEGVFTVYKGSGESGINVPDIDFCWNGGIIAPEFRQRVMETPDALLEKCIIYDGGARRYEIPLHIREVTEYWEAILKRADKIDLKALVGEKLGYREPLSYEEWRHVTGIPDGWHQLWEKEQALLSGADGLDLKAIAERRISRMNVLKNLYQYGKE